MIKIACATLCCDGFADTDFAHSFDMLPKAGIKYVEFNAWFPSNITPHKIRELKERCKRTGLVPAVILGNSFGGDNHNSISKDVAHKIRMIEAAKELGCSMVAATGSKRGEQGGIEAVITVLKEAAPVAEELGIQLCLENHAGNNIENIEDYQRIFDAIASPNIGVCLDTGHFDAAGVDMDRLIDIFKDRIKHVHVKENKGKGKVNFVRFGEGDTDNAHVIRRMLELGYDGYVTIEITPQKDRPNSVEDIRTARMILEGYAGI